ncbi:MAG: DNA/RNA non-specific endonuclease [Bacteroidota bacterium]
MMKLSFFTLSMVLSLALYAQPVEDRIESIEAEIAQLDEQKKVLLGQVEELKLERVRTDLKAIGLPSETYIEHSAMILEYDEAHEQARWVAHIITPDVITGTVFRSNDFREDPKIDSGSAVEADYFLKYLQPDSTYEYDGYGYDRGHLAPSADFRWSAKALSESYFYSNMSPQRPEFNREGWAELEGSIRGYVFDHPETQLYVVTGPVLDADLPKVERSVNGLSLPRRYFKVILDLNAQRAIGFVIPNYGLENPLYTYAVSVDEVEDITGLDFFPNLPNAEIIETTAQVRDWLPEVPQGDVEPIAAPSLPPGHFNTEQAKQYMGTNETITVVGTVVGTRYSRSGNLWFNLDRQFPNQIFSIFIRKRDLSNFDFDPKTAFDGQVISVKGVIQDFSGTPTVNIERAGRIEIFEQ